MSFNGFAFSSLLLVFGCQKQEAALSSSNSPIDAAGKVVTLAVSTTPPSSILNLTNWKLQLPYDGSDSGTLADQIKQPTLNGYINSSYFYVSGTGVFMKSVLNGAATSSGGSPRCEFREMNGSSEAKWFTTSGTHQMYVSMEVVNMPSTVSNRELIVGQVHDGPGGDYILGYKVKYNSSTSKYYIQLDFHDNTSSITVDSNYPLGESFNYKFVASNGSIKCYWKGSLKKTYTYSSSYGQYYKAGCYTTRKCTSCSEYAAVKIYSLTL